MIVSRPIRLWIMLCLACVALMVAIGGATRLTESGLSIVEWKLIRGILPPLNEEAWAREFAEYQTSPQYQKVNSHFGIAEFKNIYWLEYLHRLMGRITGLVFLLPFIFFMLRQSLPAPLAKRMAVAILLVGLQGTVGWVMVASGLKDEPRVAPLKLALHLSLAFALFSHLLWTCWRITAHDYFPNPAMRRAGLWLMGILTLQIVLGALVAGARAGLSYNTWPLMDGQCIPAGLYLLEPWWKNHLENILTIQFQHRMMAYTVTAATLAYVVKFWHHSTKRRLLIMFLALTLIQVMLGIATVLTAVELHTALSHQLIALALISVLLRLIYINTPPRPLV